MNKYFTHSMADVETENSKILSKLYEHILSSREAVELSYRPLTITPYVDMMRSSSVNFAQFYPGYKVGDFACLSSYMDGLFERDMIINLKTDADVTLYFNGEKQSFIMRDDGTLDANVHFKKGENSIFIVAIATEKGFEVKVCPLIPGLRMDPSYYAYNSWQYVKADGFYGQTGFEVSRLYKEGEQTVSSIEETDWVFPSKPQQCNIKQFDFYEMCKDGKAAYAYTYVKGKIEITHKSPMVIFEDGKEVYSDAEGVFSKTYSNDTAVLIKSVRSLDNWGFSAATDGEHSLAFVDGADCPDLQWLWIGGFGDEKDPDFTTYPPEHNIQFREPYSTVRKPVYWNFYRKDTVLKQYMHSTFFGRWFYAQMVGLHGLSLAAKRLGDKAFEDYFAKWMKMLATHRNYGVFDMERAGWASYLAIGYKLTHLDPIGTLGINICEYVTMTGDNDAKYLLELLKNAIDNNVPRFPDGTLNRKVTMWTDDMYMSLPFLVRLGILFDDEKYFDDILTQVRGFKQRMFMEDQHIFSHIYFIEEKTANRVPWGRGNGWVLLALSEVLMLLPGSYHGYEEILALYKEFAEGILGFRDKEYGIWHQVVNNSESYIETSGSAMFIASLARGVRFGWIDKKYAEDVKSAWEGLLKHSIDSDGNVYGICQGSGCNMEEKYYLKLGTITNDDHGVGIVLTACVEVMNMIENL